MSNEAAKRLRFTNEYATVMEIVTRYGGEQVIAGPPMDRMVNELTEAMAAERKATVERIRAALGNPHTEDHTWDSGPLCQNCCGEWVDDILDAEAAREEGEEA